MSSYQQIICPCCGRAIGAYHEKKEKVPGKSYYFREAESVPYLEWLQENYSLNRDYFATKQGHVNGRYTAGEPLKPEDWPEGFAMAKRALLRAVSHYRKQGWLTLSEVISNT